MIRFSPLVVVGSRPWLSLGLRLLFATGLGAIIIRLAVATTDSDSERSASSHTLSHLWMPTFVQTESAMMLRLSRCTGCLLLSAYMLLGSVVSAEDEPPAPVSFRAQVAPIFLRKCAGCHGAVDSQGDFQLHTFKLAMADGYITPGDPDDSHLLSLLLEEDPEVRMPKDGDPLPGESIELVRRWIAEGAKYDGDDPTLPLASIVPRQPHPDPPEVYRAPIAITALAFHPQGNLLAASGYQEVTLWNVSDGTLARRITDISQRVYDLDFSPDGKLLAVAGGTPGQSGELRVVDAETGSLVRVFCTTNDVLFGAAFSPDGKRLASCGADRSIRIYDVATGEEQVLIEDHADWVLGIAWNTDGTRLASASRDKTSKLFDTTSGESLVTYPGHGAPVYDVAFNADGTQVLTCGRDKKIHVWNPADGKKIGEIAGFGLDVYGVQVSGAQIFSCSADKTAQLHKADDRSRIRVFSGHTDWIYSLSYNEPSKRLATGSYNGEIRIWNSEDGAALLSFTASPGLAPKPSAEQAAAK